MLAFAFAFVAVEKFRPPHSVKMHPHMSGGEPMNATSLESFRIILARRQSELLVQLERIEHEGRASAKADPADLGDQSSHTLSREFLFARVDSNRRLLSMIEAALQRMNQGTFGECVRCGEEISVTRLKAIPWARCCIRCQASLERRQQEVVG